MLGLAARGKWETPEISAAIIRCMAGQQLRSKLPALIPAEPQPLSPTANGQDRQDRQEAPPPGKVYVANKTGDLDRIQHDVGVFTLPGGRRYVVAMLTGNLNTDREGIAAIGEVSLAVYRALS
jgi:beta-lactamase class A